MIAESLTELEKSFTRAVERVEKTHGPDAVHVLVTLNKVLAEKKAARALMKPMTQAKARSHLETALTLERELADWADAHGIEL